MITQRISDYLTNQEYNLLSPCTSQVQLHNDFCLHILYKTADAPLKTIEENERDHILLALKKCNGKIWGQGGAAELLGLPPTTLQSKVKKLGIKKAFS